MHQTDNSKSAIAAGGTNFRISCSEGNGVIFAQIMGIARQILGCKQCGHPIELIRQSERATIFCHIARKWLDREDNRL